MLVASGANRRKLTVPGAEEFDQKGLTYCATCDGWFFKDKDVIVVGGGDSALEEGLFLTRYAKMVTIVHRRDSLRAGAVLQNRAINHPKVQFLYNTVLTEISGEDAVKAVSLKNVVTGEITERQTDGIFIFIGHTPNTQLFEGQLEMREGGYILVDPLMQTNIPGVFVAGEAADPNFRQVITSAGMGAAGKV